MFKLSENWLTEGLMDTEYKQYLLLAYLRDIHQVFEHKILYPPFSELIQHHQNLLKIKNNIENIKYSEQELKGVDWKNLQLIYGPNSKESAEQFEISIIENVINFSIPRIEKEISYGKKIFNEIESHLKYTTVGLSPLNKNIGYFFIQNYPTSDFSVYRYEISSIYSNIDEQNTIYKSLRTEYVSTYTLSLSKSLTSIKQEVIRQNPEIPNPAVFSFFPHTYASMEYTILPIVKRLLLKIVA